MFVGGAGDGEHIVERHRHVGDDDLGHGLAERLLDDGPAADRSIAVEILAL